MKKYHFALCFLIGFFCSLGMAAQKLYETFTVDSYEYKITSITEGDRTVRLTKVPARANIVIPNEVTYKQKSFKVTAIQEKLTANIQKSVQSVILGENITEIPTEAFYGCKNLNKVDLKNIQTIGSKAFGLCWGLETIESGLVTVIGTNAFRDCKNLTAINFPNVKIIDDYAFTACPALSSIKVSEAPTIKQWAFGNLEKSDTQTKWLKNHASGAVYINKVLYAYKGTMPTAFQVADDTKKIASWALHNKTTLTAINIKYVSEIGKDAFNKCSKLKTIVTWSLLPPVVVGNELGINVPIISDIDLKIPEECFKTENDTTTVYHLDSFWKQAKSITPTFVPLPIENKYAITDGEDFKNTQPQHYNEITYTRNYTHTDWSPLYLPYSLKYEDWKDHFKIARLNTVHQYDNDGDGQVDSTTIEIIRINQGSTKPNKPYLIKALQKGDAQTITTFDEVLQPADENKISCYSFTSLFTFTGTYQLYTGTGHYVMGNASLHPLASGKQGPGSFRWYLRITPRNGFDSYAPKKILFVEEGDETTGLNEMHATSDTFDIYNINGKLVKKGAKNMEGIQKGIYIINGKKVIL